MKNKRHEVIIKIITEKDILTQEQLLDELKERGFSVTQATVSRDISQLRLTKSPDNDGTQKYSVAQVVLNEGISKKFVSLFKETVISVAEVDNILCIKCYTGMANATCTTLDAMKFDGVVGTIAGDDTIFVLLVDKKSAQVVRDLIINYLEL